MPEISLTTVLLWTFLNFKVPWESASVLVSNNMVFRGVLVALVAVLVARASATPQLSKGPTFNIANDNFMKDGKAFQIKVDLPARYPRYPPPFFLTRAVDASPPSPLG